MTATLRMTAALLLPAFLSVSTLQAAETVAWADLPKAIGEQRGDRYLTVVTKTGEIYRSQSLVFSPLGVSYAGSDSPIPREQVVEIRIRHRMPWKDVFFVAPAFVCAPALLVGLSTGDAAAGVVVLVLLAPVALGVGLAAAPFAAVIEGVRRIARDKVVKVAP
jgi:hypothetical protein